MLSKKRIISVSSCSLALFVGALAASSSSALANPFQPPNVGYAYVNDNTTGVNTLASFERHADGSLTPLPGSPFSIGGVGSGKGLGSQGALQLSSDGRYALAVDAASNQISVLRLGLNGVPQPVGAPVPSGGVEPHSIAVSGNFVYVVNDGTGGTNVTGFFLSPDGNLYPLPNSTVALPEGSDPGDVLFNSTGQNSSSRSSTVHRSRALTFVSMAGSSPPRLTLPCPGTRAVRLGVPADQPVTAVCHQRPQRRSGHRDGLGFQRELHGGTELDRRLTLRR